MNGILRLRNSIETFVHNHLGVFGYICRLACSLLVLLIFRQAIGYNEILSSIWLVIGFSVAAAFIPIRFLLLVYIAYAAIQLTSLSIGIGLVAVAILLIMYIVYFRFEPGYAFAIVIMPALALIKLPILIPLVLAVTQPISAFFAVIFGTVSYYMIRYISINSAVFSGMTNVGETAKVGTFLRECFTGKEFLYTIVIILVVYLLAYYIKKINFSQSRGLAILGGAGFYAILTITANLVFQTLDTAKLLAILVGAVISAVVAMITVVMVMPLDYARTEYLEFEDEEYYYYVRAVPKVLMERESVTVTRINARRTVKSEAGEGEITSDSLE
ncbi:MAG: hypothetical protein HUJ75_07620 [Parasporobacterium sp.]|nr:hypothetical protein [Parasporobacterium sp.]